MESKEKFKVMPWLRKVREKNAKETEGMTSEERIAHTRERAKWFYDSIRSKKTQSQMPAVGEKKAAYRTGKTDK